MVVDTHCHLDLTADRGIQPKDALARAKTRGVTDVVQIAVDVAGAHTAKELAAECNASYPEFPRLHWTAGIHPEGVNDHVGLDEFEAFVRGHHTEEFFLGLGETGLDYFHSEDHVSSQKLAFERHLALAQELALPVVLHLRDSEQYDGRSQAPQDALELVRNFPEVRGVLHCFTYGYTEALPFVERGWFVSYSGIVTFKSAKIVQEGAGRLPLENLLVETDAPFLAPVPNRGKINEPAFVADTLDFLARLRGQTQGEDVSVVTRAIYDNSQRFLAWKKELAAGRARNA